MDKFTEEQIKELEEGWNKVQADFAIHPRTQKAIEEILETHEDAFKKLREAEIIEQVKKTFPGN